MFWNQYPYLNLNDLNLDFLLKAIGEMQNEVKNFVTLNAVKYADPIQWSISNQYEKNTIVIDPLTGTAYISVQPVPSGVALNRAEYWTPVFDLSRFIVGANKNFTVRVEDEGVIYSTFPLSVGDWVIWNGELYSALVNMPIGSAYSIGGNIARITVEDFIKSAITNLEGLITTIENAIGTLNDLTTTDKTNLVNTINEVDSGVITLNNEIGDLNDLNTTDKSSIVNAINEIDSTVVQSPLFNVKDYGAIGDGITDDSAAIQRLLNNVRDLGGGTIVFPKGEYLLLSTLQVYSNTNLIGLGDAVLICNSTEQNSTALAKVGIFLCGTYSNEMDAVQPSMSTFDITVADGSLFAKNDVIEMHSTSLRYSYQTANDGAYTGYMAIVERVNGNVITLDHNPYSLVPDAKIRKINPAKNILFRGLKIKGFDSADSNQHGIWAKYCYNLTIENCDFYGFNWYSIGIISSVDTKVLNNRITGTYYDGITGTIFYGIAAMNSNYKMIVSGNSGNRLRHLFVNSAYTGNTAYGSPCKITVENNIMIGAESQGLGASYAFEHHGTGLDILFNGNIADGCYSGFNIEGTGVIVSNNIITNYIVSGIIVGDAYAIRNVIITDNKISNYLGADRFLDTLHASILIDGRNSTLIRDIVVSNNEIIIGADTLTAIYHSGAGEYITISNNHISCDRVNDSLYEIVMRGDNQNNAVVGNSIYGANNGIRANCYSVRDNLVSAPSATLGNCFYMDGDAMAISGNTAFGNVGISLQGDNCKVVGNVFDTTTNTNAGTNNTLIANYPTTFA